MILNNSHYRSLMSAKFAFEAIGHVTPGSKYDKWLAKERRNRGLVEQFFKYPVRTTMEMLSWDSPIEVDK